MLPHLTYEEAEAKLARFLDVMYDEGWIVRFGTYSLEPVVR